MTRRLIAFVSPGLAMIVVVAGLYAWNHTPVVPPLTATELGPSSIPYVIKIHAQWCPVCLTTKGVWSEVEQAYAGRVRFVVFDRTNERTTAASRAEARRLGLEALFDEADGTGTVVVADGRTGEVRAWIAGSRDFREYASAIDAALVAGGETPAAARAIPDSQLPPHHAG